MYVLSVTVIYTKTRHFVMNVEEKYSGRMIDVKRKSTELKKTNELVKEILQQMPESRNSDDVLYLQVCERIYPGSSNFSIQEVLMNRKRYNLPAFESVRRTRQKTQALYPELAGNSTVEGQRILNEEVFRAFARKKVL